MQKYTNKKKVMIGFSSFARGFFNKILLSLEKNKSPTNLFLKQKKITTPAQRGCFHHG